MLKVFLRKSIYTLSCHGGSTAAQPVEHSLTVYTTIGCRSSRMFRLSKQHCCICASGVTAVTAASASLRRTPSFPDITVPPAGWLPRSSPRSVKRCLLQRSAHSSMFRVQRPCGTSNTFLSSLPDCQRFFPIDEFKGNSGGQKYNSIVVDAEKRKAIDILPNRFEDDLIRYFSQFQFKTDGKYFVCDMDPHSREVVKTCFPKAAIVADRYHVIRQVYWAMERVRKK